MRNLLCADMYKLRRSRTMLAVLIVTACSAAISVALAYYIYVALPGILGVGDAASLGISVPLAKDWFGYCFQSGNLSVLIAIFVSVFVSGEFSHRTIHHSVTRGAARPAVYLSKLITCLAGAAVLVVTHILISVGCAWIAFGFGEFAIGEIGGMFATVGTELLLFLSLATVFTTVAFLIRGAGGSISVNICAVLFTSTIVRVIDVIIQSSVGQSAPALANFLPSANVTAVSGYDTESGIALRAVIVALAFIAVFAAVGIENFSRRDIK